MWKPRRSTQCFITFHASISLSLLDTHILKSQLFAVFFSESFKLSNNTTFRTMCDEMKQMVKKSWKVNRQSVSQRIYIIITFFIQLSRKCIYATAHQNQHHWLATLVMKLSDMMNNQAKHKLSMHFKSNLQSNM